MTAKSSELTAGDLADARKVAESFLDAAMRGDEAAAKGMLILTKGESLDFKSMHESIGSFALAEPKADGAVVVVVATVTAKPGQDAPPPLPLVVTRAGGGWKIDMGATMSRLMGGVDLDGLMQTMAEGIGNAMGQAMKGLGDAMAQGLGAVAQEPPPSKPKGKRPPAKKPRKGDGQSE